jgi:hypothetical protein
MENLPECGKEICCYVCGEIATCRNACAVLTCSDGNIPIDKCVDAVEEQTGMQVFENDAAAVIKGIADIVKQKKLLEEQESSLREQLEKAMNECGVKKFENELLSITYVAATTRTSIDSKSLKKDLPEIAEKYSKVSNVKSSIKITVK